MKHSRAMKAGTIDLQDDSEYQGRLAAFKNIFL